MTLRAGVVGCGFGADVLLPALRGMSGVAIAALADGGSGRAASLASGIPGAVAMSPGDLACAEDLNIVVLAVPPQAQAPLVRLAAGGGKTIFCEKPLGTDAAQAAELSALVEERQVTAAVDFLYRYDPGVATLRELLAEGAVGRPLRFDVTWLTSGGARSDRQWSWRHGTDGGIVADFGVHVLDYLEWLSGAHITAVSGRVVTRIPSRPFPGVGLREVTAEDECDLVLRLGDTISARATVSNTYPQPFGHRIEVFGTDGYLCLHHKPPFAVSDRILIHESGGHRRTIPVTQPDNEAGDSRIIAARSLLTDLIASSKGVRTQRLPTFADAARITRLVDRARILRDGKA